MKFYNFVYNYGFLSDWMKANPEIKRGEILQSMGMSDYGTLGKWIDGATMMPMAQLMRFCNRWCVPVSAFFLDEKAEEGDMFAPITSESNIEPVGGWPNASRKAGIKVCDPRTSIHMPSRLPGYIHPVEVLKKMETTDVHASGISDNERMRYLDLIEKLNDRVMALSQEVITLQEKLNNKDDHYGYGIAAEPDSYR